MIWVVQSQQLRLVCWDEAGKQAIIIVVFFFFNLLICMRAHQYALQKKDYKPTITKHARAKGSRHGKHEGNAWMRMKN